MSFDDDLDAQLALEKDWADVEVLVNGKLRTFRFTQMDALDWADLAAKCPPDISVLIDKEYGYNVRQITLFAAPKCGVLVEGDDLTELDEHQWTKLIRGLAGGSLVQISSVIFNLNEWLPAQAIEDAKKALRAESVRNSLLPVPSESPAPDSLGVSLESSPDTSTTTTDA